MSGQAEGEEVLEDDEVRRFLSNAEVGVAPGIKLDDVVGIQIAKEKMMERILLPAKFPQLFAGSRRPHSSGFLIYGPPGAGKTMLVQAAIAELGKCNVLCYKISVYDLLSRWLKDPTKALRAMFRKTEGHAYSMMFIDDFEVLCEQCGQTEGGRRLREEFISLARHLRSSCLESVLCIVGITNKPWKMADDSALRRIMDRRFYTPLPDSEARIAIFKQQMSSAQHSLTEEDFRDSLLEKFKLNAGVNSLRLQNSLPIAFGERSDGLSGADISIIVRNALMEPIRKIQAATHFKQISGPSPDDPNKVVDNLITPCSSDDQGATEMNWTQADGNKLVPQAVTMDDVIKSLSTQKPSVSKEELDMFEQFNEEWGTIWS